MKRTEWIAAHPAESRKEMAQRHPLAYHLQYPVQLLLPGKGWQEFNAYDFQQLLWLDESKNRAANKMRQGGLTTGFGYEAWWKLTHVPGTQILVVSKNSEAVENFISYVSMFDKAYGAADPSLPKIGKDNKRFVSYPAMHSWVKGVASDKRAGTSFTATDFYFDETAHAKYAEEIYQSAMPMIAKTGGTATLFSSPAGRGNLHHRIHTAREQYDFSLHQYEWWWVPEYNPSYQMFWRAWQAGDHKLVKRAVDRAKLGEWYRRERPKYTESQWAEEFECSFDANTANFFTSRTLASFFFGRPLKELHDPSGMLTFLYHKPPRDGWRYYNGIDFGRKRDATVSWTYGLPPVGETAVLVDFRYIAPKTLSWPQIITELERVKDTYKLDRSRHDSTGLGDVLTSAIEDWSEPYVISNNQAQKKLNLLTMLAQAMDQHAIQAPRIIGRRGMGDVVAEHEGYQLPDTGLKTDTLFANALAASCFFTTRPLFTGFDSEYSYV